MHISTLHKTLAVGAALVVLACLPTPAHAQFTLNITPSAVTAMPGDMNVPVSGTLTDTSGAVSGPFSNAAIDVTVPDALNPFPTTDPRHDLFAPFTLVDAPIPDPLGANQVYTGTLFDFEVDPAALPGTYATNFNVQYGTKTMGQDFTIQLGTPVPEAGTVPLLALGAGFVLLAAWRRRTAA